MGHVINSNKIGIFSDIHLGLGQDSKQWHDISLDFAKWASEKFLDAGIRDIVIPGDVFHNRTEIGVNTLSITKQFFDFFKDFRIFISTGNHDCYYKDNSTVNSLSILDGYKNIHIIENKPEIIKTPHNDIVLVPWATEYDNIPETNGIIFGHFEISTFYMNSYKVCEHGMSSKELFSKAPFIISGHFHKKDHRVYNNGQILYVGSPYQHNFGDAGDDRGIYIFDLSDNTFEFINNDISPKHYKLSLKKITENNKSYDDILKNNIVSLVIDTKIDHDDLLKINANIQKFSPLTIRTDYEDTETVKLDEEEKTFDGIDILKNLEDYVNTLDIEYKPDVLDYLKETYNLLRT
jgi:DNA repair exonuclease SbcCD nuclease subunit